MARQLRIEFPEAHYHVFARGERKDTIFLVNRDYEVFIEKLKETLIKYNVECAAFVLMPNHYHLYLITPEANLTKAIHYLNSSYTNWYKAKHEITGHVFQGRYKALLVDKDNYFFRVINYIHLNPVESGIVKKPWDYKWGSCLDYVYGDNFFDFVNRDLYLKQLDKDLNQAQKKYKKVISRSKDANLPHRDLYKGLAIGKKKFKEKVDDYIKKIDENVYIPSTRMNKTRNKDFFVNIVCKHFNIDKKELFKKGKHNNYKKVFVYFSKKYSRMTNAEIGSLFDLHPGSISDIYSRLKKDIKINKGLKKDIRILECEFRRPDPRN
ncbi:MAG: transposase [Candidatus Muiribacteriota bacterium]